MKNFLIFVAILLLFVLVHTLEQNDIQLNKDIQETKQELTNTITQIESNINLMQYNLEVLNKEKKQQQEQEKLKKQKLEWFNKRYSHSNSIPKGYFKARGKQLTRKELEEVITKTLAYLPHADTWKNVIALLLETAIVESNRGRYTSNKRSSAVGIWQILPSTAEDCHKFLKYYPLLYKKAMALYDKNQSLKWNLIHNLPYTVAIAYTVYWRKVVGLNEQCNTLGERGTLWKTHYNTYKDKHC